MRLSILKRSLTGALVALAAAIPSLTASTALAQETRNPAAAGEPQLVRGGEFLRVVDSPEEGQLRLEVAVRELHPTGGAGPAVLLVGAVHIGDKSYYEAVQEAMAQSDIVLFEGVKPGGAADDGADRDDAARARITTQRQRMLAVFIRRQAAADKAYPESLGAVIDGLEGQVARIATAATSDGWGRPMTYVLKDAGSPRFDLISLGADGSEGGEGVNADLRFSDQKPLTKDELEAGNEGLQLKLARALGLEYQLAGIDYNLPNWRNSDLSIDEVRERLDAAGASGDMLFNLLSGSSMSGKIAAFLVGLIEASPQMSMMVKVALVETLGSADAFTMPGNKGEAFMKVIIEDRNDAVIADLKQIIKEEPATKEVAIFYGAGHLPHMEKVLTQDMGYALTDLEWIPAISITLADLPGGEAQARQMQKMIQRSLEQQRRRAK